MKLIFISGPSGSGKTTLSNQIKAKIKNSSILSTDNYYKTGLISKLLSNLVEGYYDKRISLNYKLFKKDFNFILKNGKSFNERSYNFQKKTIKNIIKKRNNINFLIVEGIFAEALSRNLNNDNYFFLELKVDKNQCMKRVVERDLKERGKVIKKAEIDFLKSWDIYYYEKYKNKKIKNNTNEFIITNKTNIDNLLKKFI